MLYAKVVAPHVGYDHDKENIKVLDPTTLYEVTRVNMSQSHTTINLKNYIGSFNSIQFEFVNEEGNEVDIYSDPRYNPYLKGPAFD